MQLHRRSLALGTVLSTAVACQAPVDKLANIPCTDDAQCPTGFHCEISAEARLDGQPGSGKCAGGEYGPIVEIIAPAEGARVKGLVDVGYKARDSDGLEEVKLYVNGTLVTPPGAKETAFTTTVDTRALPDGSIVIRLVARDILKKTTERSRLIRVDNTPPLFAAVSVLGTSPAGDTLTDVAPKAGGKVKVSFMVLEDLKDGAAPTVTVNGNSAGAPTSSASGACTSTAVPAKSTCPTFNFEYSVVPADAPGSEVAVVDVVVKALDPWENEGTITRSVRIDPISLVDGSKITHVRRPLPLDDQMFGDPGAVEPLARVEILRADGVVMATTTADVLGSFGRDALGEPNLSFAEARTTTWRYSNVNLRAVDQARNTSVPVPAQGQRVILSYSTKGSTSGSEARAYADTGPENDIATSWEDALSDGAIELTQAEYLQIRAFDNDPFVLGDASSAHGGLGQFWRFEYTLPAGRYGAAVAYDTARDRVVSFGGVTGKGVVATTLDRTLEFDGDTWADRTPTCDRAPHTGPCSPTKRAHAAAAYDPERKRVVLYGGVDQAGALLAGVWEWDGSRWFSVPNSNLPANPTRARAAMAWDPTLKKVVLFGGRAGPTDGDLQGDLWAWGPSSADASSVGWERVTTQLISDPLPSREGASLMWAKLGTIQGLVVYGGYGGGGQIAGTAYALTVSGWQQVPFSGAVTPQPRWGASMGYDSVRERMVVFGGCPRTDGCTDKVVTDSESDDLLFEWDGAAGDWMVNVLGHRPTGRSFAGPMVWDEARRTLLLSMGAHGATDMQDVWRYQGGEFYQAHPTWRIGAAMAYDLGVGVAVMFGGDDNRPGDDSSDTWLWDGQRWEMVRAQGDGPPARSGAAMTYVASSGKILMYGGCSRGFYRCVTETSSDDLVDGVVLDDLWEWSTATRRWTDKTVPDRTGESWPNPRMGHVLGYEPLERVLLAGGRGHPYAAQADFKDYARSQEVWLYNGDTWERSATSGLCGGANPTGPCKRQNAAIAYDPVRQRTLISGGWAETCAGAACPPTVPGATYFNDTWEWDGFTWTRRLAQLTRMGHAMVYDPARARFVILGGSFPAATRQADVYAWNASDPSWFQIGTLNQTRDYPAGVYDLARGRYFLYGGATDTPVTTAFQPLSAAEGYTPKLYMLLRGRTTTGRLDITRDVQSFEVHASFEGSGDQGGVVGNGALLYVYNYLAGSWEPLAFSSADGTDLTASITQRPYAYIEDDTVLLMALPAYPALRRSAALSIDSVEVEVGWRR